MFDFKFDWDDRIGLGIEEVDQQHKELFRICRDIEQIIITGAQNMTPQDILSKLCELREYVTYHFYMEEQIIAELNREGLEAHRQKHEYFKKVINQINCNELVQNPVKGFNEIKVLLQEWLFDHILIEDRTVMKV